MRPTWGQLRQFCVAQGYQERRTDHFRYIKVVRDRFSSGTIVSFGKDGETIPAQLWGRVWKQQLKLVGEDEFWKSGEPSGQPVQYDFFPPAADAPAPLPAYLARFLRDTLHWSDAQIAAATRDEAQGLLNAFYTQQLREH